MRGTIQQRSSSSLFCRREQFWHGQGCPLFDVVYPAFPLPTMVSPTLQGALKGGFGEAVEACDMPDPCKFQSLDSCQTSFLWTQKVIDLTPHPVVGLVPQVGHAEKFSQALGLECLNPSRDWGAWMKKLRSPLQRTPNYSKFSL